MFTKYIVVAVGLAGMAPAAYGQVSLPGLGGGVEKPSDLDPFNKNGSLREGLRDWDKHRLGWNRRDQDGYTIWPEMDVRPALRLRSAETGIWIVPLREEHKKNGGRLCLWNVNLRHSARDQHWSFVKTRHGYRIVNASSGLSLVPLREEVRKNGGKLCLWDVRGDGVPDQNWRFQPTKFGHRIVNAESGLSIVPIREDVSRNLGRLCLWSLSGDGVRDQNWVIERE